MGGACCVGVLGGDASCNGREWFTELFQCWFSCLQVTYSARACADYLAAACALIPEVLALMDAEPDPDALLRAGACPASENGYLQGLALQGRHVQGS